jgi:hypothetical protein
MLGKLRIEIAADTSLATAATSIGGFNSEFTAKSAKTSQGYTKSLTCVFVAGVDAGHTFDPVTAYRFHSMLSSEFEKRKGSPGHLVSIR